MPSDVSFEMWSVPGPIPQLTSVEAGEPNERAVMHRTRTLDYVVVIEGEVVLVLDDSEVDAAFSDELLAKLPKPLELLR